MMKRILLVSNEVFHYRIKVYNYFYDKFLELGYEFIVLTNKLQKVDFEVKFKTISLKFNIHEYIKQIKALKPDVVINFLHLKDYVQFFITAFCKLNHVPVIYWNKGINIKTPNNWIKNSLYYLLHNWSDAILLYTPGEKKYIRRRNHGKLFYAYNTLNFSDIDKEKVPGLDACKKKYGIKEDNIILFAATIKPDKGLDYLLDNPLNDKDTAVVIAGRGISAQQLEKLQQLKNYYYVGEVPYDNYTMEMLFKSAKIFTTPTDLGLAVNQALFWGVPIVALKKPHSVEVYYLKDGVNGFLVDNMEEFWEKARYLIQNEQVYQRFSEQCIRTMNTEGHIDNMFHSFVNVITYCLDNR